MSIALLDRDLTPARPRPDEIARARKSSQTLAHYLNDPVRIKLTIARGTTEETVELPAAVLRPMIEILTAFAQGQPTMILPMKARLTTQEAADLLQVSRPHLIKLLEKGELRFDKVGSHRRIEFSELIRYKRQRDQQRDTALDELADIAQKHGMGY
jgi:excisionase family DNA binding protein